MKYLYVLVSSENDYYAEQALLSVFSLRKYNPDAFISFLVDTETESYLQTSLPNLLSYVNELKIVELPCITNKEKSRILKTSMRDYVEGDFLFIDCDTIICDDLSDIVKINCDMSCVLDTHVGMDNHTFRDAIITNYNLCDFKEALIDNSHFNSGVIYCKDNERTRKFFKDWRIFWEKGSKNGVIIDQPSFNQANILNNKIIVELSGEWNCQLIHGGVKYLSNARIIHYFSSINNNYGNPFIVNNKDIFQEIKKNGEITSQLRELLDAPRQLIEINSTLLGCEVPRVVLYQAPIREIIYLFKNHKHIYNFFRYVFYALEKFHR